VELALVGSTAQKGSSFMHTWNIFYEAADSDAAAVFLGTITANTMSDALDLAAQYYEYPAHDLVAVQIG